MYNPAIDTFIRVAELGSFSKAAEETLKHFQMLLLRKL